MTKTTERSVISDLAVLKSHVGRGSLLSNLKITSNQLSAKAVAIASPDLYEKKCCVRNDPLQNRRVSPHGPWRSSFPVRHRSTEETKLPGWVHSETNLAEFASCFDISAITLVTTGNTVPEWQLHLMNCSCSSAGARRHEVSSLGFSGPKKNLSKFGRGCPSILPTSKKWTGICDQMSIMDLILPQDVMYVDGWKMSLLYVCAHISIYMWFSMLYMIQSLLNNRAGWNGVHIIESYTKERMHEALQDLFPCCGATEIRKVLPTLGSRKI